jgi:hypothetical protein
VGSLIGRVVTGHERHTLSVCCLGTSLELQKTDVCSSLDSSVPLSLLFVSSRFILRCVVIKIPEILQMSKKLAAIEIVLERQMAS